MERQDVSIIEEEGAAFFSPTPTRIMEDENKGARKKTQPQEMSLLDTPIVENQITMPMLEYRQLMESISQMKIEIEDLRNKTQNPSVQHFSTPLNPNLSQQNPYNLDTPMKARDIPILTIESLQGIEANARLEIFFESIEKVTLDNLSRIQMAKSRVSSEIQILIHNKKPSLYTWRDLKEFLTSEFRVEMSFDAAWQEIEFMKYDWCEPPQAFVHKFICRHAALMSRFPDYQFPNRDRQLKRKLWKGMPKISKARLEEFLGDEYPLSRFMERLAYERRLAGEDDSPVWAVKTDKPQDPPSRPLPNPTTPVGEEPQIHGDTGERLENRLAQIENSLRTLSRRQTENNTSQYCGFCRMSNHSLRDCNKRPPLGHCFDCGQKGCRRGSPTCPAYRNTRQAHPATPPPASGSQS